MDRRAKPGGHWNDAYDFVRLHQPAAFYGVNSLKLGSGGADLVSKYQVSQGLVDLAMTVWLQILAYYETVLASLLETGRVTWFPHTEHREGDILESLLQVTVQASLDSSSQIIRLSPLLIAEIYAGGS